MSNASLFYRNTLQHKLFLMPNEMCRDIDAVLLRKLRDEVGNKCIKEGFVRRDSIEIVKRSIGVVDAIHFNGRIGYNILFSAELCNPVEGMKLEGVVEDINKMGAIVRIEPLSIVLPKQHHPDLEVFRNLAVGDKIQMTVVGSIFELYDTEINTVAIITNVLK